MTGDMVGVLCEERLKVMTEVRAVCILTLTL